MSQEKYLFTICKSRKAYLTEYFCVVILLLITIISWVKQFPIEKRMIQIIFILGIIILIYIEISRLSHRCKINNSKIVLINGLIMISKNNLFLSSLTDVDTHQNHFQRLLGYGNIHFKSASGTSTLEIKDINHPEQLVNKIESIIEKYKNKED